MPLTDATKVSISVPLQDTDKVILLDQLHILLDSESLAMQRGYSQ